MGAWHDIRLLSTPWERFRARIIFTIIFPAFPGIEFFSIPHKVTIPKGTVKP
jgi:hypothetical protein